MTLSAESAEQTRALGARLARLLRAGDVVVLSGVLGAGKTTFAQGVGEGLGVRGPVTSPTFVIARVHPSTRGGPPLLHVDLFRLGGWAELADLDLEASLDEAVTVVEWGTGLVEGLAPDRVEVALDRPEGRPGGERRGVAVRGVGDRWRGVDLAAALAAG